MLNNNIFDNLIESYIKDIELSDSNDKVNERIVFEKIKEYCELVNKDFFTFSYEDMLNMFNYLTWTKSNVFQNRKCIILRFLDYAEQQGYCTSQFKTDFRTRLKKTDLNKDSIYENELFNNFDSLYDLLIKIKNSIDLIAIDKHSMTVGIIYLIWLGFTLDEITLIQEKDFDFEKGTIKFGDKIVENLDIRIKGHLENIKNETEITVPRVGKSKKDGTSKEETTKKYIQTGYLIKCLSKNGVSVPYIRTLISNFNKLTNVLPITDSDYSRRITYKSIYLSGLYERIRRAESILGVDINAKNIDLFNEQMNDELLKGKTMKDLTTEFKVRRIINDYTEYKEYLNTRG